MPARRFARELCAMMPEPTTAASRKAAPSASATARRGKIGGHCACAFCGCAFHAAILLELVLQAELVDRTQRQRRERADALKQHPVRVLEGKSDFGGEPVASAGSGSPNGRHRLARQSGHASPAALSQTVNTKSKAGPPGLANRSMISSEADEVAQALQGAGSRAG